MSDAMLLLPLMPIHSSDFGDIMKKIITIATLISLLLSVALIFTACGDEEGYTYDYLAEDLSQYIQISEDDYKNYVLTIKMSEITDSTLDEQLMHILYEYRSDVAENPGKTVPLTAGDTLEMWYRGYVKGENGEEIEIDGFSNMTSGLAYKLGIGSASLPLGVESSLIGVVIADYESLEDAALKEGDKVSEGDVLYLSYSLLSPKGKEQFTDVRVDLTRTDLDATFGEGFCKALLGTEITEDGTIASFTTTGAEGKNVYSDVKILKAYPKDSKYLTVTGTLPYDWEDYELAGTTVYFDIFPHYFTAYELPELGEEFILEVLELTAEDLAEYEGETLVDKYKASIRAELELSNEEEMRRIREEAMWYHYNEVAKVIEYPEDAVLAIYEKDVDEIKTVWEQYQDSYPRLDDFARAYLSLTADSDWEAKLMDDAKAEVKEKLIFYYIIRKEGLLPSESQYRELYDKLFDEYVVYYMEDKTAEDYTSVEAYEKARADAEVAVMSFYGDAFFRDQAYYDFAIDALLDFAVVEKSE